MVNAIVMASGFSNRMGTNKLLLPYKGKYLIEHILDNVIVCPFNHTMLVAKDEEILKLGEARGICVIHNNQAERGQSESIKLGISHCSKVDGYAFFSGDQPLMDVDTIKSLLTCFNQNKGMIIVPTYQNIRGTPVIFPEKYKTALLSLKGDAGGKMIISQNLDGVRFIEVSKASMLWDIDTEEDYQKLILEDV